MSKRINKRDLLNKAKEIKSEGQHLALTIVTPGNREVIIVPNDDIENKLRYIDNAYDSNLDHKSLISGGVKITDVCNLEKWIEEVREHGFYGLSDTYRELKDKIEAESENQ
jgi:hypothetical protein